MKNKNIYISITTVLLLLIVTTFFIPRNNEPKTISDIAYDSKQDTNCVVYIKENDKYEPYLVITNNYNKKTLLLRKDLLSETQIYNYYDSYYLGSAIDTMLNNEFAQMIEANGTIIKNTKIEITTQNSIGFCGIEKEKIKRKVFLLSCTEVGFSNDVNQANEGSKLKYFNNPENRIAHFSNGKTSSWWLRTPNTYYNSCPYTVGDNNQLGYTNAFDKNGIRPAFCVDSSTQIAYRKNISEKQDGYILMPSK